MNEPLAKAYNPEAIEKKWRQRWEDPDGDHDPEKNLFKAGRNEKKDAPRFCMVIPPPNITGQLHVGHALNHTLQDIIARYRRMLGDDVLWLPGTDHAGIATQNVVERQLKEEKQNRYQLGRERFVKQIWAWRSQYGERICEQMKLLGDSVDWTRLRFTLDDGLSKAVRKVFVQLFHEKLIYQGNRLINWCPRCRTALSDDEVEHLPTQGHFWHIAYPVSDGSEIIIATTRPETLLGDTAVAVHPTDSRYLHLRGKTVTLPLLKRSLPIIIDDYVKPDEGTGALKVTPGHDFADFEIGVRHQLELISMLDEDGRVNAAGGSYAGLDRFDARKKIVADLEAAGQLRKVEDREIAVGHCYRCQTIVEPRRSKQWFVRMKPLAEPAIAAVRTGRMRFVPQQWENTYFAWMESIRDWCISRQIWWGHRIPVWGCADCQHLTVSESDPLACEQCQSKAIEQDPDVLDTWFSSALWPFSTLGWPAETEDLTRFYPTNLLVTSHDIIFFWVARMMMMGLHFMPDVPFRQCYIHALVRDEHGKKYSKSLGNALDPIEVMNDYGTDAFRFTLAALAQQGRSVNLAPARIAGYRNFVNKLWNATRFVQQFDFRDVWKIASRSEQAKKALLEGADEIVWSTDLTAESDIADQWITSKLLSTISAVRSALDEYRFNDAASALYQFTWHDFCDWYVELAKPRLSSSNDPEARITLFVTLRAVLRLTHPFIPFVTEELWASLPANFPEQQDKLLAEEPFPDPTFRGIPIDAARFYPAVKKMELIIGIVSTIRTLRSENNISPKVKVVAILCNVSDVDRQSIEQQEPMINSLARLEGLNLESQSAPATLSAHGVFHQIDIYVPLSGLIDIAQEQRRLQKEIDKIDQSLAANRQKLANPSFLQSAPQEVVERTKRQQDELAETRERLLRTVERLR